MTRQEHLERTLKNIRAVGDGPGSASHRLYAILNIVDGALEALRTQRFDGDFKTECGQ